MEKSKVKKLFKYLSLSFSLLLASIMLGFSFVSGVAISNITASIYNILNNNVALNRIEVNIDDSISIEKNKDIPFIVTYYPSDASNKSIKYEVKSCPNGAKVEVNFEKKIIRVDKDGDYSIVFILI